MVAVAKESRRGRSKAAKLAMAKGDSANDKKQRDDDQQNEKKGKDKDGDAGNQDRRPSPASLPRCHYHRLQQQQDFSTVDRFGNEH